MSNATITVLTGADTDVDALLDCFGSPSVIQSQGANGYELVDAGNDLFFFVSGSLLTYTAGRPNAGTISEIVIHDSLNAIDLVTLSFAGGISAAAFDAAIVAFQGGNGAAFTAFLDTLDITFTGGAGKDTFTGFAGSDIIQGGDGGDILNGGGGVNTLSYASDTAGVTVNLGFGTAAGGHAQGDSIANFQNLIGGAGSDTLLGSAAANALYGSDGNDFLLGGAGADIIDGGKGNDYAQYYTSTTGVTIKLGVGGAVAIGKGGDAEGDKISNVENLYGTDLGNDVLTGNELANVLIGAQGNDTLDGGAGDDFLNGGIGADTLIGGAGIDTVYYGQDVTGVTVTLGANGAQTIGKGGTAEGDKLSLIENIEVSGYDDVLTGNNLANSIFGGDGNDVIEGGAGGDILNGGVGIDKLSYAGSSAAVTVTINASGTGSASGGDAKGDTIADFENLVGSAYNDVLTGDAGANIILGGAGNDTIEGGGSFQDTLDGGAGINTISYAGFTVGSLQVFLNDVPGAPAYFNSAGGTGDLLLNFQNIIGSNAASPDYLKGNQLANNIKGLAGDDTLEGHGGNDTLEGGDGNDYLNGGAGSDILIGGAGVDSVDYYDEFAVTGTGVTVKLGKAGAVSIGSGGEAQGDQISQVETVFGTRFNDILTGNELNNSLYGYEGDDVIEGGAGADILFGGDGIDTLSYASSSAGVTVKFVGVGLTALGYGGDADGDGVSNFENIIGSAFNDVLKGDEGINIIDGRAGDDLIEGGKAGDTLIGGAGLDTLSYESSSAAVTVLLKGSANADVSGGDATADTVSGFENIIGSAVNDVLKGDAGANVIEGGDGDDELDGGTGNDTVSYAGAFNAVTVDLSKSGQQDTVGAGKDTIANFENIIGSVFADSLKGNAAANKISGGDGDDVIEGGAGADIMDGGNYFINNDTVSYASDTKGVTVTLGMGGKKTAASGGDAAGDQISNFHSIRGGSGNDVLTGNDALNYLYGGAGNDKIFTKGADFAYGEGGDDIIEGSCDNAVLDGGTEGALGDTISYALLGAGVTINLATNLMTQNGLFDFISDFENIIGSAKNDILTGDNGANSIDGGAGDDLIEGLAGADKLNGSLGIDTVSYSQSTAGVTVNLSLATAQVSTGDANGDVLSGFENIIGAYSFSNKLTGDSKNNVIEGGQFDDILDGGLGNNTVSYAYILGGAVSVDLAMQDGQQDTLAGGKDTLINFQNIIGSDYGDSLYGDAKVNIIKGGAGIDWISGGAGADILDGGGDGDTVVYHSSSAGVTVTLGLNGKQTTGAGGDAQSDKISGFLHIEGSNHKDILTGNNLVNNIYGNGGDDLIQGGLGADFLNGGGDARDTVSYSASSAGVTVTLIDGMQTVGIGGDADGDTIWDFFDIIGSAKDDVLTGSASANIIDGGAGNDVIEGGKGADTLKGNTGIDTLSYKTSGAGVTVDLKIKTALVSTGDASGDIISGFENLIGASAFANVLTGDASANIIMGGSVNDTLDGGAGNDTADYSNASGKVTVDLAVTASQNTGSAGFDTLINFENLLGSANADTLFGDKNANVIRGSGGDDVIEGRAGADTLDGESGTDTVSYASSAAGVTVTLGAAGVQTTGSGGDAASDKLKNFENIVGSAFVDKLKGNGDDNTIKGGAGNDIIEGGVGADSLDGEGGINTLSYAGSAAGVIVDLVSNTASGGDADLDTIKNFQNLLGSSFDDILYGDSGANTIDGGAGADAIEGGAGDDILIGGTGLDVAMYSQAAAGVTVSLAITAQQNTVGAGKDTISGFESLYGSDHNDKLTGNSSDNTILGGEGDDIIDGGLGNDLLIGGNNGAGGDTVSYASISGAVTVNILTGLATGAGGKDSVVAFEHIIGGGGADVLTGSADANNIDGGAGNDVIEGGAGADTLRGGTGVNTVSYASSSMGVNIDLAFQGHGATAPANAQSGGDAAGDLIYDFQNITGSAKSDFLSGDNLANTINGGDGDDRIAGRAGADMLDGGNGFDILDYTGSMGGITIALGAANVQTTGTGNDAAGDKVKNFEGVLGSDFNDVITGNAFDNLLQGGIGADKLTGGLGADTFQFLTAAHGGDTITDFVSGTDKIGIAKAGFMGGLQSLADGPLDPAYFVSGAGAVSPDNAHGYFEYDTTTRQLFWDVDGLGGDQRQLIVTLGDGATLSANDIALLF